MTDKNDSLAPDIGLAHTVTQTLSRLLDYFDKPTILISPNYRILAVNHAYETTYSSKQSTLGKRCYTVSHQYTVPCDLAGETCPIQRAIGSGKRAQALHVHYTSRGEEHVNVEITPIYDDAGQVCFLVEHMYKSKIRSTPISGEGLVGRSKAFLKTIQRIQRVAPSQIAVLLLGESGTGKELAAQAIHQASNNTKGAFVPVECSGLAENLFESELFGHEKGAFTGAIFRKLGLVEAARDGTLFLDEVGDIPLSQQVKLLRLLEMGTYRPVGSIESKQANFRLVCATNRNLKEMVEKGLFRQDLYFRINAFPIRLPPLRERQDDLPVLIETLLHQISAKREIRLTSSAFHCLQDYAFPGNIRELRNILQHATLLTDDDVIRVENLPEDCRGEKTEKETNVENPIVSLEKIQDNYLKKILADYHGNRKSLAKKLGISERTLYRKIELLRANSEILNK